MLLSNGGGPYSVLNINNLTTNITPLSGVAGVEFTSSGEVTLNVATGPFQIITDGASGIFAGGLGVTIVSTANITTTGDDAVGIGAGSNAALSIVSLGNISTSGANAHGIFASATPNGDITITSIGNIATEGDGADGIISGNIDGKTTINSFGNIETRGSNATAIEASANDGQISITSVGNIAVVGPNSLGIEAFSYGAATITSIGNIATEGDGAVAVSATSFSDDVRVTSFGEISTTAAAQPALRPQLTTGRSRSRPSVILPLRVPTPSA